MLVIFTKGVPGKGCTLFPYSKVFPYGFSLERVFKEADFLDRLAPFVLMDGCGTFAGFKIFLVFIPS